MMRGRIDITVVLLGAPVETKREQLTSEIAKLQFTPQLGSRAKIEQMGQKLIPRRRR
jgi:hypothetical protein